MANHKQAAKRNKQRIVREARNKSRKSRALTFLKYANEAIEDGNKEEAKIAVVKAESELMKAVSKGGVFKKKTASRRISRLNTRFKKAFAS